MAYGFPVQASMILEEPRGVRSANNPGLPGMELPSEALSNTSMGLRSAAPLTRLPGTVQASEMSGSRKEEAEKYAQEMKVAFATTRQADKESRARAKAKGKAAQRIAESR